MSYDSRGYNRSRQDGNSYNRSGGGGGGRFRAYVDDRRGYKRRLSPPRDDEVEDIEVRLRGLIIKIGDKISPELQVNLNKMKNILENDYSKYPDTVQNTLKACIVELPAKAPVYGTLYGLLNVTSHDLVGKLVYLLNDTLKQTVAEGNWAKLKQLLRFYGELANSNVISPTSYCGLVEDLLSVLDEPTQYRRRSDCIIYIILSTLPWSAQEIHKQNAPGLNHIMQRIGSYMDRRPLSPSPEIVRRYKSGNYDNSPRDELHHLWTLIQQLRANDWEFALISRLYRWFEKEFSSALQHEIPRLTLPEHTDELEYIAPESPLRINVDDAGVAASNVPDHNSLEYFVLNDVIVDILRIFEPNRKECGKYLLAVANSFEPGHFRPLNPQSQEKSGDKMDEDEQGWCLPDLLLEVIMSQMLRLPSPPFRQVYYSCILTELCRADTVSFPLALGRTVKVLFERLEDIDIECVYRLSCWFAHHLSNFGFQWDWAAWEHILNLEPDHPQVIFTRETLEKMIRLSYYERVKSLIPDVFYKLIPSQSPAPSFAYQSSDHPLHNAAKGLIENLRAKKSADEIQAILEQFKEEQARRDMPANDQDRMMRELFVQSTLLVGSKSFSHVLNVVERYLDVLRYVNGTPEARLHTVQIIAEFWKENRQFMGILLDKLLNYRIIDPASIISWVFEKQQLDRASNFYAWEILQNTLAKVVARVSQVRGKLESAKATYRENEAARAKQPASEMALAEKQQESDTLRILENSLSTVTRDQKEVFMSVYQKFVQVLQDELAPLPAHTADTQLSWNYLWILGWYRETMRMYYKECSGFLVTLETVVFTEGVNDRIRNVFTDVKTLNSEQTL
ncbi:armadillo-type protein [Dichotomocladium elegans]|nr:armadillo-type protein [Dichotomocladium elegans]